MGSQRLQILFYFKDSQESYCIINNAPYKESFMCGKKKITLSIFLSFCRLGLEKLSPTTLLKFLPSYRLANPNHQGSHLQETTNKNLLQLLLLMVVKLSARRRLPNQCPNLFLRRNPKLRRKILL